MNNAELAHALWAIESHINKLLVSPHEGAGTTRLQEALEDAQDLQVKWNPYKAMHLEYCLRCAADLGTLSHEKCDELVRRLGAAMRAEPDPEDPGESQVTPSKRGKIPRAIFRTLLLLGSAIAVVLMVTAAVATVMQVAFGDLLWSVASITGLAVIVLSFIWSLAGGDTGPSVSDVFKKERKK